MSVRTIKVPDIGEGIAEVELVAWHVQPGQAVAEDQPLVEVMTDKASVEIPSPVSGTVLRLGGEAGDTLAVGSVLILIETAGAGRDEATGSSRDEAAGAEQGEAADHRPPPAAAPSPEDLETARRGTAGSASSAGERPPTRPPAHPAGDQSITASTARIAIDHPAGLPAAHPAGDRPIASPSVRRRAWELGLALEAVPATGPGGRIMHADLDAAVAAGLAPAGASGGGATHSAFPGNPRYAPRNDETTVPIVGVRRLIARRMQESAQRIPHFSYVEEVDVTELEALRAQLNAQHAEARGRLTLLPFLIHALVPALREFPRINARFDDTAGRLLQQGAVHVGIATDTPAGLLVPVLRHAETLDLWSCAARIAQLADTARAGRASRAELSGSTITITSLGALGGIASTPVINAPEVAIVGVNRIVERPVIRAGSICARRLMNLSSSFDHRVIDGVDAARFIQAIRIRLESPALLFIE